MNSNDIFIYDVIGEWGIRPADIAKQISNLGSPSDINVRINSPGGDVFDGFAIYNLLQDSQAKVHMFIDGLAASIASVITMAGDTVSIAKTAMMMVHNPVISTAGDADDLRSSADLLEKTQQNIALAYNSRTSLSVGEILEIMNSETWFSADEAVKFGFADSINDSAGKAVISDAAAVIINSYVNVPKCVGDMCDMNKNDTVAKPKNMDVAKEPVVDQQGHFNNTYQDVKPVDAEQLATMYPELITNIKQEAATNERDRIQSVEASSLPGHEALISKMRFDGVTTGAQAALAVVKAERLSAVERGAARSVDAVIVPPSVSNESDTLEQAAELKWASDEDLRAAFGDSVEDYNAYNRAVADGQVNIVGRV